MKKIYFLDGKQYEVIVRPDGRYLVTCSVYEVTHPNRKIFRTKYLDTKTFFIEDYLSIEIGVKSTLGKVLLAKADEVKRRKKWEEFENTY